MATFDVVHDEHDTEAEAADIVLSKQHLNRRRSDWPDLRTEQQIHYFGPEQNSTHSLPLSCHIYTFIDIASAPPRCLRRRLVRCTEQSG